MISFDVNSFESSILEESARSPIVAMMRLSLEIDRQLRMILGSVGALSRYSGSNPVDAIDALTRVAGVTVPTPLRTSLADFWQVRNAVVHGKNEEGLALRAIDYGLRILRIVAQIPRPSFIVRAAGIALYQDKNCISRYSNGNGVILQSFSGDGKDYGMHIHPSRLSYEIGDSVSWEWDQSGVGPSWDDTWYRDPFSEDKITYAWTGSMEFRGRPIESV